MSSSSSGSGFVKIRSSGLCCVSLAVATGVLVGLEEVSPPPERDLFEGFSGESLESALVGLFRIEFDDKG